jgi:two-component system, NtrC family, sensor histidine kinase HupT/HoxJ
MHPMSQRSDRTFVLPVLPHERPAASPADDFDAAPAGVDEAVWLDVIRKMEEVYSQLLEDEVKLEEKNIELEQSQQFIFSLLSAMSDVLVACNERGEIEETNAALCDLVGRSDGALLGTPVLALLADDESRARLKATLDEARGPVTAPRLQEVLELKLLDRDGQPVPVDMNVTPRLNLARRRVGTVLVGRPMAEIKRAYHQLREAHEALKRTQQQLLHSEKMASLGRLVAGVAHELNNPISFVLGNVHALQRYADRLQQYLDAVHGETPAAELDALRRRLRIDHLRADLPSLIDGTLEGAQRTADIVAGLKRFSAVDREERQVIDLADVVERAIHWVRKGTAPGFEVRFQAHGVYPVLASRAQLQQVLMNLVQNAYDAAHEATRARDGSPLPPPYDLPPTLWIRAERVGEQVVLKLRDNGPGIFPEHLHRIFDPFFTTKPVGKGTGLGLSISYGIVEQHGGTLTAANHPQGGAEFTLSLPRTETPLRASASDSGSGGSTESGPT